MIDIEKIKRDKGIMELLNFSIINIDKPAGMTSFDVDTEVKNIIGARKTSHFGTLDPMVTGVLPIALGRACRLMEFFIHRDKIYVGEMHIHQEISEEKLKTEIKSFIGKIKQLPPVKSRVKRQEREREIYSFEILKKEGTNASFIVECEAGTYIRKLIHDLGEKINGAHMTKLRRIKASIFSENESWKISDIETAAKEWKKGNETLIRRILIPGEIVTGVLPCVEVKQSAVKNLLTGKSLLGKDVAKKNEELKDGDNFCVLNEDRLIAIMKKSSEEKIIGRALFVLN